MAQEPAGREASTGHGVRRYERHRPEQTLLYRLVEQHYPDAAAHPWAGHVHDPGEGLCDPIKARLMRQRARAPEC